jgi:lysophospholipase L1-like esterase
MMRLNRIALAAVGAFTITLVQPAAAGVVETYLALGDSMAFGETDFTHNPSNGDRGYVGLYADYLGALNGGVRPNVINLGVDAETSTTFFQGGPQGNGTLSGFPAPQLNTNYPNSFPTQNALMLQTIASEQAAGHVIRTVSVQLGANDMFVVVNQPNFFSLTPAQQQALIGQAFATLQTNYTNLLLELKSLLPQANLILLDYHNPFNAAPNTPIGMVADPVIQALSSLIAGEASAFGARFVDIYKPFLGNELADTLIVTGNVHPNAQGYQLIVTQLEAAPEPSSLFLMGTGLAGGLLIMRRRHRAA